MSKLKRVPATLSDRLPISGTQSATTKVPTTIPTKVPTSIPTSVSTSVPQKAPLNFRAAANNGIVILDHENLKREIVNLTNQKTNIVKDIDELGKKVVAKTDLINEIKQEYDNLQNQHQELKDKYNEQLATFEKDIIAEIKNMKHNANVQAINIKNRAESTGRELILEATDRANEITNRANKQAKQITDEAYKYQHEITVKCFDLRNDAGKLVDVANRDRDIAFERARVVELKNMLLMKELNKSQIGKIDLLTTMGTIAELCIDSNSPDSPDSSAANGTTNDQLVTETKINWYFTDNHNNSKLCSDNTSKKYEILYKSAIRYPNDLVGRGKGKRSGTNYYIFNNVQIDFGGKSFTYNLDFGETESNGTAIQTNVDTDKVRTLHRKTELVMKQNNTGAKRTLHDVYRRVGFDLTNGWETTKTELPITDPEYQQVKLDFLYATSGTNPTMSSVGFNIRNIIKVVNPKSTAQYNLHKAQLKNRSEIMLWHGVGDTHPVDVISTGLRINRANFGYMGKVIYGSESPYYSHRYYGGNNYNSLLYCRFLIGDQHDYGNCSHAMALTEIMNNCDSAYGIANHNDTAIHGIPRESQCDIAYIVTYSST